MAKGINGKDLMLFKGTGVGKKAIGLSTSCSLAVNASVVAVTTKDSGDISIQALYDYKVL